MYRVALALLVACSAARHDPTTLLRTQTQELLDAVAVGNKAVWQRYLDPGMVYVSESGTIESKTSLLAQLDPLPAGTSGKLAIQRFTVTLHGDTAVVVYVAGETMSYFGQALNAEFLTTDTWRSTREGWRLVASAIHVKLFDPPAIELPPEQLDEYVGTYTLTPAIHYTIRRDGTRLVGQRTGRDPQDLRVEVRDVLFVPGQPRSRKVFVRDNGKITKLLDRREGHDVIWSTQSTRDEAHDHRHE